MFSCPISARRLLWSATLALAAALTAAVVFPPRNQSVAQAKADAHRLEPATRPARIKAKTSEADEFFASGVIPRLHIEIAPAELQKLKDNPRVYVRASVREAAAGKPDRAFADVGVHLKGSAGSFRAIDNKPAMTLSVSKFVKGRRFYGLDKFCLNNSVQDPSYLCEGLGGSLFRDAGVPTPRMSHARVWLNSRDLGLFVLKESFSEVFLKRFFRDHSGTIYEGNLVDIDRVVSSRATNARTVDAGLKDLVAAAHEPDLALRRQRLEKLLDVDRFFTFMAMETMIAHWDGYTGTRNNYRIYHNPDVGKLVFLPHGMDQLFQRPEYPLVSNVSMLGGALSGTVEDRVRHLECLAELRQRVLDPDRVVSRLDQISARILPALEEISPQAARDHKTLAADLRQRIFQRVRNIDRLLASAPRPPKFNPAGLASLSGWEPRLDDGNATVDRIEDDGKACLRIRSTAGRCTGSWRTTVLLAKGRYVFEGQCRAVGVASADGPNTGVGLRISTGKRQARLIGDSAWQKSRFEFEVDEPCREVVLACELRASSGEARFELNSLMLRRQ
jgi:spore coat protein H